MHELKNSDDLKNSEDLVKQLLVMSEGVMFCSIFQHIFNWPVYTTCGLCVLHVACVYYMWPVCTTCVSSDESISVTGPPQNALRSLSSP